MTKNIVVFSLLLMFCNDFGGQSQVSARTSHGYGRDIFLSEYRLYTSGELKLSGLEFKEEALSYTIPIKRAGNLILLEAIIDSIPGNLILDTGSAALVLNSMYFRDTSRPAGVDAGGITGSAGSVSLARVGRLQISELSLSGAQANITDLSHLEKARNVRILGFFGLAMFVNYELVIDLQNGFIELHRLNFRGKRLENEHEIPVFDIIIPARVESNILFVEGSINNKRLTFCLDTGAESNVLSSHLSDNVLNTIDIIRRSSLQGAGSHRVEILHGLMNAFSIEKKEMNGMNVIITNLNAMSNYFGIRIDGMLGCDFIEQGVFYLNLKQKRIGVVFNNRRDNE